MKYYWLIITILFIVKIIKGKRLSSYNIKWMFTYIIYILWLQAEVFNEDLKWEYIIEPFIWSFFLIPLISYLVFPFIWKYIGKWRVFRAIDEFIDKWYKTIKELNNEYLY